ncbi:MULTISPECIES: beta-ketoacyl synthase N-terminal-like domain-containing protein [unclassified Neisseria]|uniref:beta-ketoacyl synthase N-terminal-like domain-containing protein n=1 Tax=unclassified Neisseria TaxID=2623750 RepID=UPI0026670AF5|nr:MULTISPECIES: beta-ketoacyl synthase N-terminal-like domain-containing protein [unclassified Neisseria]MDO1508879.1 beta-ketoacyl synthase N-terminal-like domain-containing protein [Neisseria sp. MVDL19-042950]MDO1515138.1 beta-ketoacyl synthase N-terminal-like domain-containing protein [Neisseria sp. MVDL18-041461]MDO1562498.1 beta-ketoacyl synthase N-terminal-like domain-containing protein [Neisseria sp. MVDL20-010259]
MAVYVTGASFVCAQGENEAAFPPNGSIKPPAVQVSQMLGQTTEWPYFKAFGQDLLTLPDLFALLEKHMLQTASAAGWEEEELGCVPILIGSTAYVVSDQESRFGSGQDVYAYPPNEISEHLRRRWNNPHVYSFATSCTSSAQAIGYGCKMIENGFADKALVIGFEMFNRFTFEHFQAMQLLSSGAHSLPLADPQGIILGEGLACVALSAQPGGNRHYAISGISSLTDHESLTNSSDDALRRLIAGILKQAGVDAAQIQTVKVHATGGIGDEAEEAVLREMLPHSYRLILKPYTGHPLGAAGALETALMLRFIQNGRFPALPDAADYTDLPTAHGQPVSDGLCLHYFLGFGGSNIGWVSEWCEAV